jgi:hypothetical protein
VKRKKMNKDIEIMASVDTLKGRIEKTLENGHD